MDEATPTSRAKPPGVIGAEIGVKVGGSRPVDPSELDFLALDTKTPYMAEYAGAKANQATHSMLRWVNFRGQKGPLSETASAAIGTQHRRGLPASGGTGPRLEVEQRGWRTCTGTFGRRHPACVIRTAIHERCAE